MKYFVLGAIASGMLLYGMSMIYGVDRHARARRARARRRRAADRALGAAARRSCSSSSASRSSSAPCRSTCGCRTSITARRRRVTLFLGYRAEDRVVRARVPPAREGLGAAARRRLAGHADVARGAVARRRQRRRDRADATSSACSRTRRSRTSASSCSASSRARSAGYEAALYYTIAYVLMAVGAFGVIILLSRAGFEAERARRLQGPERAQPVVRARDADAHVLAWPACRRSSASGRSCVVIQARARRGPDVARRSSRSCSR